MVLSDFLKQKLRSECDRVLAINSPAIDQTAKMIAFYVAMIDAAKSEPMDDAEEQEETIAYMQNTLDKLTETYQELVNDLYEAEAL